MLVKQLSVFMENRKGRLRHLTGTLGKNGIDLVTLSIADTKDYGIVRFIARDNQKALDVLKQEGFTVGVTELIGVEVGDTAGALADVLRILDEANIGVEYLYSFARSEASAKILLRVQNPDEAVALLEKNGVKTLSEKII